MRTTKTHQDGQEGQEKVERGVQEGGAAQSALRASQAVESAANPLGLPDPAQLNDRVAYLTRELPDGRVLDVVPLLMGRARLVVSRSRADVSWYEGW